MCFRRRQAFQRGGLLALCGVVILSGCGRESAEQALNSSLAKAGIQKEKIYPFAGKVTIDGQPPQLDNKTRLVVMLYNPRKPDIQPALQRYVDCGAGGQFAFTTYTNGDGVPAGKYIVLIAELNHNRKKGYLGPDQLKNQYNDPDKNYNVKEFNIDHVAPGKKDYEFALRSPEGDAAAAGPKSLVKIPEL
jgi:hypothetical protein